MDFWLVFIAAVGALLGFGAILYNRLIRRRQLADNGWSDIDVQLKRRADLIPSLVETVQGYARHERALFEEVTRRRAEALAAGADPARRGELESALSRPVAKLVALAEDYPDLKAHENFLALQRELSETEDKIEMSRRFYNGAVRELNVMVETIPSNIVAGLFGFAKRDYFEIERSETSAPSVSIDAS